MASITCKKKSKEINQENIIKIQLLDQEIKILTEEIFNLKNLLSTLVSCFF